jgi:hypothetical protein
VTADYNTVSDSNPPTTSTQGFVIASDGRGYTPKTIDFEFNSLNGDSVVCPGNGANGITCKNNN